MLPEKAQDIMKHLGFSPNEIRCYCHLLKTGKISVPELAELIMIDRRNAYQAIERLIGYGLATYSSFARGRKVTPLPPQKLLDIAAGIRRTARRYELKLEEILNYSPDTPDPLS